MYVDLKSVDRPREPSLTGMLITVCVALLLAGAVMSGVRCYEQWRLPANAKLSRAVTERFGKRLMRAGVTLVEPGTRSIPHLGAHFGTVHYREGEANASLDFGMASSGLWDGYRIEVEAGAGVRVFFAPGEGDEYDQTLAGTCADVERALTRIEGESQRAQSWR